MRVGRSIRKRIGGSGAADRRRVLPGGRIPYVSGTGCVRQPRAGALSEGLVTPAVPGRLRTLNAPPGAAMSAQDLE